MRRNKIAHPQTEIEGEMIGDGVRRRADVNISIMISYVRTSYVSVFDVPISFVVFCLALGHLASFPQINLN